MFSLIWPTLPYLCKSRWILSPFSIVIAVSDCLLYLFAFDFVICFPFFFSSLCFLFFCCFFFACDKDNNRITDKIRIWRFNVFSFSFRIGYGLALRSPSLFLYLSVCLYSRSLFAILFSTGFVCRLTLFSCLPFVCYLFSQRKCYKLLKRLRFVQLVCYHIPTHIHIHT